MGSEIFCYICYIMSWYAMIPAIYRIIKRKSSTDYSKQAVIMEVAYNLIWLVYVTYNPTFELFLCAVIDVILILIYGFVVFKYHKKNKVGGVYMIQDAITAIKEKEFHNSRQIFAFFDGKLNFCEESGLSHHEWLVGGNLFCDFVFQELVRGYIDAEGVYFYMGDFETNDYVETVAKSCINCFDEKLPIYCGVIKGEVGEKWKPIKQIR